MYYFIVNPNSRSGAGQRIWSQVRRELERRKVPYKFALTRYVGHAEKIAAQFSECGTPDKPVTLIVMGGDGTIHEVLSGIRDLSSVIFGFIPTGSGNDFCRGMHLPQEPMEALKVVLGRKLIRCMDVPRVTLGDRTYRFGISTGIGYDAAVCQEVLTSPAKKVLNRLHLGKLIYLSTALKQMFFQTPVPAVLQLDGGRTCSFKKLYFAAVMNQQYEGGGFRFCPLAKADDGVLDVIAVDGIPKLLMLLALPTAFFGAHTKVPGIHLFRCSKAVIRTAKPMAVHIDGESGGLQNEITTGLESKQIKIIMP